jgi:hypothetical protein
MKKIKFSHVYEKMYDLNGEIPKRARLLEVFVKDSKELYAGFINYDTLYWERNKEGNEKTYFYSLPKGKVIVLLLKTLLPDNCVGHAIWTTIRRYTQKKYDYYMKSRWEEFEIVINKETEK